MGVPDSVMIAQEAGKIVLWAKSGKKHGPPRQKNGYAKLKISLAKGKKLFDKRETIKDRENKRNLDRVRKDFKK